MSDDLSRGELTEITRVRELASQRLSDDAIAVCESVLSRARGYASANSLYRIEVLGWTLFPDQLAPQELSDVGIGRSVTDEAQAMVGTLSDPNAVGDMPGTASFAVLLAYLDWALSPTMLRSLSDSERSQVLMNYGPLYQRLLSHAPDEIQARNEANNLDRMNRIDERIERQEEMLAGMVSALEEVASTVEKLTEHVFAGADEATRQQFRDDLSAHRKAVWQRIAGKDVDEQ